MKSKRTKSIGNTSLFVLGVVGVLFLSACAATQTEPSETDSSTTPIQIALDAGAPLKEITIDARQFSFEPATITVQQGDVVRLTINSLDVGHGIAIPGFGVDVGANAGSFGIVNFVADRKGEFPFYCSIYCGAGHGGMRGLLIVE